MNLTFFVKKNEKDGYWRFDEEHIQKAFESCRIEELLIDSLFKKINMYGKLNFLNPKSEEEKIFFIARK